MKQANYLKFAISCALEAGKIIKKGFYSQKSIDLKGFANPVTEFDRQSEAAVVGRIERRFPSHSILTEEELSSDRRSEIRWIIDPLDGTVNFTHQIPFVCVSIGVEVQGEITAGVIYNPILNELYTAEKNSGAFLNGKPIHVSDQTDPGVSLLVTGFPYEREGRHDHLIRPIRGINERFQGFRRLGAAAIDLAYVAKGSFEGFYEENLKPWDTAAGKLLVEEAGGTLTNYRGECYRIDQKTIVATNGHLHAPLLELLKDVPSPK